MQDYDIIYSSSDYYTPHLGASIVSILENIEVKNAINFHILDFGISESNKAKLRQIIAKYNALNHIFLYDSADSAALGGHKLKIRKPQTRKLQTQNPQTRIL